MSLVFTVYEVGRVGLHGEIEAKRLTRFYCHIRGGFIEIASGLECGVLVDGHTDRAIVRRISRYCENKRRHGEQ